MTLRCRRWTLKCQRGIKQALPSATPKSASATSNFLSPREGELYQVRNLSLWFRTNPDSDLTGHESCSGSATGFSLSYETPFFSAYSIQSWQTGTWAPVLLGCSVTPFLALFIKIHHHSGSSSCFDVSSSQESQSGSFPMLPARVSIHHTHSPWKRSSPFWKLSNLLA